MKVYKSFAICNAIVGLMGIGSSFLQRRHNRLIFWLMLGSGISLIIPLIHFLIGRWLYDIGSSIWKRWAMDGTAIVVNFYKYTGYFFIQYILLVSGMLDLVFKKRAAEREREFSMFMERISRARFRDRGALDTPPQSFDIKDEKEEGDDR